MADTDNKNKVGNDTADQTDVTDNGNTTGDANATNDTGSDTGNQGGDSTGSGEKSFTQKQVSSMMAKEKKQGREAAYREMGIDPNDSKMVNMFKAFINSALSYNNIIIKPIINYSIIKLPIAFVTNR